LGRIFEVNGEQPRMLERLPGLFPACASEVARVIVFRRQGSKSRALQELNIGLSSRETGTCAGHTLRRWSNSAFKITAHPVHIVKQSLASYPRRSSPML